MFEIHDYVRYGSFGLFQIVGKIQKTIKNGVVKDYYVLYGVQQIKTRIETPVENPGLRKVLSMKDIDSLITKMPDIEPDWIMDKKKREEEFHTALRSGDCIALVRIMKTMYAVKEEKARSRKQLSYTDHSMLAQAQQQLLEEIAFSAHMSIEEADSYIRSKLSVEE